MQRLLPMVYDLLCNFYLENITVFAD